MSGFQTGVYLSAPHQTLNQGEEEVNSQHHCYIDIFLYCLFGSSTVNEIIVKLVKDRNLEIG